MTEKKENSSQKTNQPQEIDLVQLFSNMGKGISSFFTKIFELLYKLISMLLYYLFIAARESIRFSLKKSPILIAFIVAGYIVGSVILKTSKPYYRTNSTIQTFTVSSSNLIEYINKLTPITENRDSIALSGIFDIPVSEAASIRDIEAYWLIDKNNDGVADMVDYENAFEVDTILNWQKINSRFIVQMHVFDPAYISTIQEKFENYLATYPRLEKNMTVKKQTLQTKIQKTDAEIVAIDSLKSYEYFTKPKQMLELQQELAQQTQSTLSLDKILFQSAPAQPTMLPAPELLHNTILPLYNSNVDNKAELDLLTDPYIFIDKFKKVANPVNVDKEKHIKIKFTALFFFMGILFSLLLHFRKDIIQFIKE